MQVREIRAEDRPKWAVLWQGYLEFYGVPATLTICVAVEQDIGGSRRCLRDLSAADRLRAERLFQGGCFSGT